MLLQHTALYKKIFTECWSLILGLFFSTNFFFFLTISDSTRIRESGDLPSRTSSPWWCQRTRVVLYPAMYWWIQSDWFEDTVLWCSTTGGNVLASNLMDDNFALEKKNNNTYFTLTSMYILIDCILNTFLSPVKKSTFKSLGWDLNPRPSRCWSRCIY